MELLEKRNNIFINPWTNVYGLARTFLALGTLLTLVFNDTTVIFKSASGIPECPLCFDITKIGIFCLFKNYSLNVARWLSIFILILIISGWRPRLTGLLHWWISFSLNSSAITLDGGDQVANVLTFLLIPITVLDNRHSHWSPMRSKAEVNEYAIIFGNINMFVIRIQVALIYFHAAVGKLKVTEWIDGTALYYYMQDPLFVGLPTSILNLFRSPFILTISTWSVMIFELALFLGIVAPLKMRKYLLILGIGFHLMILIFFGLASFACSMIAALILYLRPWQSEFNFQKIKMFYAHFKHKYSIK